MRSGRTTNAGRGCSGLSFSPTCPEFSLSARRSLIYSRPRFHSMWPPVSGCSHSWSAVTTHSRGVVLDAARHFSEQGGITIHSRDDAFTANCRSGLSIQQLRHSPLVRGLSNRCIRSLLFASLVAHFESLGAPIPSYGQPTSGPGISASDSPPQRVSAFRRGTSGVRAWPGVCGVHSASVESSVRSGWARSFCIARSVRSFRFS